VHRRDLKVGGLSLAGFVSVFLLLIDFGSFTERVENRSFRESLAEPKPVEQTSVRPTSKRSGFAAAMYMPRQTPCALDESASAAAVRAVQDHDQKTLDALLTRRTLISLSKGTMFDADSTREDVIWGFVRSGPKKGEYCSVIASFLSTGE
jgi:phage head maturation protease